MTNTIMPTTTTTPPTAPPTAAPTDDDDDAASADAAGAEYSFVVEQEELVNEASKRTVGAPTVAPFATIPITAVSRVCALAATNAPVIVVDETATVIVMEVFVV